MELAIGEIFTQVANVKELWDSIKEIYGHQNNCARIFQLKQELSEVNQENKIVTELLATLKPMWDELAVYCLLLTTDIVELKRRNEQEKNFQLLRALKPEYEQVRSQLIISLELRSLSNMCATLIREETRKKVMSAGTKFESETSEKSTFISAKANSEHTKRLRNNVAEKGEYNGTGTHGSGQGNMPPLYCTHCGKTKHTVDRCWAKYPHLRPSQNKIGNPYAFQSTIYPDNGSWIIDSGATDHMTGNKDSLTYFQVVSDKTPVSIANGSLVPVKGIGRTTFFSENTNSDDQVTEKTIGEGRMSRGLYYLDQKNKALIADNGDLSKT
ncbi:uncharacterized protein LOC143857057 [Tasmannia lanceolata]|uniref:uncharacterized protein LOC143857057 n=1 Tax=Tasmannia lanceolata TaxID=3420 RepID=UPI004062ED82